MRNRIALLASLLIACSTNPNGPAGIQGARHAWNAQAPENYRVDQDVLCFCVPPRAVRVEVRDGEIFAITDRQTGAAVPQANWGGFYTIDGLFDLIANAERQHAAKLEVKYHATDHYPTSIVIDYLANAADDEVTIMVVALTPMP